MEDESEHFDWLFERVDLLISSADAGQDEGETVVLAKLAEAGELLDRIEERTVAPEFEWLWSHHLRSKWHQGRALMHRDIREVDAAIAETRLVIGYWDAVRFRTGLAKLLWARHTLGPDLEGRLHLAECVRELRELVAREYDTEADRGWVFSLLGQALHEQFRCAEAAGESPAPELLDEAEDWLNRSFALFSSDSEKFHAQAVVGLARLKSYRAGTGHASSTRDLDEAASLYEVVAVQDPAVAFELACFWQKRFSESEEPLARAEALRWLDECENDSLMKAYAAEIASRRGQLWLSRAREDRAELTALVEYLQTAFAAEPVRRGVGVVLVEAHWLAGDAEGVVRVSDQLVAHADDEGRRLAESTRPHRAIAVASLALRGRADLAEADALLQEFTRDPKQSGELQDVALALLVAVRTENVVVPENLAATVVGEQSDGAVARALFDWLIRHEQPGADWLCAVALLAFQLQEDGQEQIAALRAIRDARAAVAESDELDGVDLELLFRQATLMVIAGVDANDRDMGRGAVVLLDEYFGRTGPDHPRHVDALGLYGNALALLRLQGDSPSIPLDNAVAALTTASSDADTPEERRAGYLLQLAGLQMFQIAHDRVDLYGSAVRLCEQAMSLAAEGTYEHGRALFMLGMLLSTRFYEHGERHDLESALGHLRAVRESAFLQDIGSDDLEYMLRPLEVAARGASLLDQSSAETFEQLAVLEKSDWNPTLQASHRVMLATTLLSEAERTGDLEIRRSAFDVLTVAVEFARDSSVPPLVATNALTAWTLAALLNSDLEKFRQGVDRLEEIQNGAAITGADRTSVATDLVLLWRQRFDSTLNSADIDEALRQCAKIDLTLLPEHSTGVLDALAERCWYLASHGYGQAAVAIGFNSMELRARNVLVQSEAGHAAMQAADAAVRGQRVALQCAELGELGRAVEAVERGRGLVLHSATVTSGIEARLQAAGRPELAEEWEREPATARSTPSDVRRRVLAALDDELEVMAPPSSEEIGDALRALDFVSLVHLVPGQNDHVGRALVTTADGAVIEVLLPLLVDGPDSEVGRYLAMDDQQRREALPALCAWAWQAAVEPLLRGASGEPPWFVLVPAGALGVVPWHAAAGEGRSALREAGFTYAASARQLCELARRDRQPVGASPVVVSDPTGTLIGVQYEAEFLHGLFPHGHFYGQVGPSVPRRGAGTPDELLAESGASLQHLGCHARAGATPARSALHLARADLSVERMLRHAERRNGTPGGLVVLAACESDLTAGLHDEALTLAAAYVAAGGTGVIGTKWKVDDIESALLMCVFYDFLVNGNMRPRDALRAVQLWALDPGRVVPAGVARHLAERGRAASLADPVYWAAFAHHGW
ncbi:hypothetical protein GCM10011609_06940 [Lentzea pudingi]|uniref:CHAT domain-containing protein n=1 Tax=Lentzea pudingi TaxID=1789439 RepID=A0ABQ2HE52_9PSEU|nr:CHAT domain-containing protein [Lentzea pudingi]GGM73751.1 hypothetical protein GCM10011609_06940 [Lentzea pudingi]